MIHRLKTWPVFYQAIQDGTKTFEIRNTADRKFSVGDKLLLEEFEPCPDCLALNGDCGNHEEEDPRGCYSGRSMTVTVTYVTNWEQHPGFVVMAIAAAPKPSGIEAMVCASIAQRQALGIAKYGQTVADRTAP